MLTLRGKETKVNKNSAHCQSPSDHVDLVWEMSKGQELYLQWDDSLGRNGMGKETMLTWIRNCACFLSGKEVT